jgi:hypothetical protein
MADIKFYGNIFGEQGDGQLINHGAGSGIGFYGNDHGISVPVGSQQSTTFITDAVGANRGPRLNNTAMYTIGAGATKGKVSVNGTTAIDLDKLPNYLCPLNIRFTHTDPVKVQNCKLRIFDRDNIEKHASGVTTYVYEARHPSTQNIASLSQRGRSEYSWMEFESDPLMAIEQMDLTPSPGASGKNTTTGDSASPSLGWISTDGPAHASVRHDWYLALSSEPVSIGSKTQYGLYFTAEYVS